MKDRIFVYSMHLKVFLLLLFRNHQSLTNLHKARFITNNQGLDSSEHLCTLCISIFPPMQDRKLVYSMYLILFFQAA